MFRIKTIKLKGSSRRVTLVIAHRGSSAVAPENTLAALLQALLDGADACEIDIQITADGYIVVCHDLTVDRTTDGTGRIKDMSFAQIRALDAGYRFTTDGGKTFPFRGKGIKIPTLDEVLEALPTMRIFIEVKSEDGRLPAALAAAIERHHAWNRVVVLVIAVKHQFARRLRKLDRRLVTGHTSAEIVAFSALARLRLPWLFRSRHQSFEVPIKRGRFPVLTGAFLSGAHRRRKQVFVWTVNDPAVMAKLIDMGVDGMFTDNPAVMRRLISAKQ